MLTVCYKTKTPEVYNKGTQWEKKEDTFLLTELQNTTREEAEKHIAMLNETKPMFFDGTNDQEKNKYRLKLNWDEIEYLFLHEQEAK